MKIKVDKDLCIGCALCVNSCDKCFKISDDGKSEPIEENCRCDDCDLSEIAASCPAGAISVEEE